MGRFRWLGWGFAGQRRVLSVALASALVVAGLVTLPVRAVASPVTTVPAVSPSQLPAQVVAANPYQSFVQASYHDFLGRLPLAPELSTASGALQSGSLSVGSYLTSLSTSNEWLTAIVTKMYADTLHRSPDPAGLTEWVRVLRTGQRSVAEVASFFYASDEYFKDDAQSSTSEWVTLLYQKLLNRNPDPLGLAQWVVQTGQNGRSWVAYNFYQSDESRMKRVDALYQTLLARGPDPVGWAFWKVQVLSTGDLVLATQIAGSQEYWDKSAVRYPTVPEAPSIQTSSLPDGDVGVPYSTTMVASGGALPYTWAATGLPAGLSIDRATGVVSGTPTSSMINQPVTFTVTDTILAQRVTNVSMTIYGDPVIAPISLPYMLVGSPVSAGFSYTWGGAAPKTWSASGLPPGLSLDPTTGALSGTPTTAGSFPVTITLTDMRGKVGHKLVTLVTGPNVAAVQVSVGAVHSCALTSAGGVRCWGNSYQGEVGDGTTQFAYTPVDVVGLTAGVVAISAKQGHTCALTASGGVKCWGDNRTGELGDGTTVDRLAPVDVVGLTSGVVAISSGGQETCALTSAGGVKCWGLGYTGGLGDGTTVGSTTPKDVVGLGSGVIAIAAGSLHACAVTTTGAVKCWGNNERGQLGDGTTTRRNTPVDVVGMGSGIVAISAGAEHTCAVSGSGRASCWGWNFTGQLGDGTTTDRWTPVGVTGLTSGVTAIDASDYMTCALAAGGAAECWGQNTKGGLGDGTTTDRPTPAGVVGLGSGVKAISAGGWHACALTSHGGVKCWGANGAVQLGDGTTTDRWTPVDVYGFAMA